MLLKAEAIYKSYNSIEVLKGISLEISKGEIISIVGASGAGKSTLLNVLGTLEKADKGEISFGDQRLSIMNQNQLALFRNNHLGFIFQFFQLLPEFTAIENIIIPSLIKGVDKKSSLEKAYQLLERLNLNDRADHKPSELSGGEQQRVAIARALINSPELILADEPSGNLDSANANELHSLLFELRKEFNQTFIIVTHNIDLADRADRKLLIRDGHLV
ncbi:MAG TPA: ABC transporter ATP-binding protein [Bacteroidia bacterium]|nr:ABC transporter ATP-binding protein [Bacteroidia bacterium]